MNGFVKVHPEELPGNAIALFNRGWALLTAGDREKWNTMTISWGQLGELWNLPICTVFVRPARYTYSFMERSDSYTVCLFDAGAYRKELGYLGSASGRDVDKMSGCGLTPVELDGGLTAFAEASAVLVIDKLYDHQFDPARVPERIMKDAKPFNYANVAPDDLHRIYIGAIREAYVRQ